MWLFFFKACYFWNNTEKNAWIFYQLLSEKKNQRCHSYYCGWKIKKEINWIRKIAFERSRFIDSKIVFSKSFYKINILQITSYWKFSYWSDFARFLRNYFVVLQLRTKIYDFILVSWLWEVALRKFKKSKGQIWRKTEVRFEILFFRIWNRWKISRKIQKFTKHIFNSKTLLWSWSLPWRTNA